MSATKSRVPVTQAELEQIGLKIDESTGTLSIAVVDYEFRADTFDLLFRRQINGNPDYSYETSITVTIFSPPCSLTRDGEMSRLAGYDLTLQLEAEQAFTSDQVSYSSFIELANQVFLT